MTWRWLLSCWNASRPRSSPPNLNMSTGFDPARVNAGTSPRTGTPSRSEISSDADEASEGAGGQGGEHGCDEPEGERRHRHGAAGVRRRGRELRRTEFGQHEEGSRVAVGHLQDAGGRGVGICLSGGRIRARRIDRDRVRTRIARPPRCSPPPTGSAPAPGPWLRHRSSHSLLRPRSGGSRSEWRRRRIPGRRPPAAAGPPGRPRPGTPWRAAPHRPRRRPDTPGT